MNKLEITFVDFKLKDTIIKALTELGYKKPSPIQEKCIPYLLSGRDVLGIAQTGSGKTAAFSLPLLNNINPNLHIPQILIIEPTRELAIQVTEAITSFSKYMHCVNAIALYGGKSCSTQLHALRYGPQVIVGTPGRLLYYIRRGVLDLSNLKSLVLDEADEMLRMGFIEDVETIIMQIPKGYLTALFSATMPETILRITRRFMKDPYEIRIKPSNNTRPDIIQKYCIIKDKNEALMRFLEIEEFDAAIIFVRTKNTAIEVAEMLKFNGYNSAPLNGDMNQTLREQTIRCLKDGSLDILVATDIAARGLDIMRINLVLNYDIPIDSESYIHRIGRTGRAGRVGRALLFVENHERRLLRNIERLMKLNIPKIELPNIELLSKRRLEKFVDKIKKQLKSNDLNQYRTLLSKIQPIVEDKKLNIETLAAALLKIAQGKFNLIIPNNMPIYYHNHRFSNRDYSRHGRCNGRFLQENNLNKNCNINKMELYRIELGRNDGIEVRHIVGAIANETEINSRYIGNIKLFASYSTIELPKGMSVNVLQNFTHVRILNKPINIQLLGDSKSYQNRSGKRRLGSI